MGEAREMLSLDKSVEVGGSCGYTEAVQEGSLKLDEGSFGRKG